MEKHTSSAKVPHTRRWLSITGISLAVGLAIMAQRVASGQPLPEPIDNAIVTAKLQLRAAQEQARQAARAKPQPSKNPAFTPPTRSPEPFATGIMIGGGPAPVASQTFVAHNQWVGVIGDRRVTVYAGADRSDPAQGKIVVSTITLNGSDPTVATFAVPGREGAVTVVEEKSNVLTLETRTGTRQFFDAAGRRFVTR